MNNKIEKGILVLEWIAYLILVSLLISAFFCTYIMLVVVTETNTVLQAAAQEGAREYAKTGSSLKGQAKAIEELHRTSNMGKVKIVPTTGEDFKSIEVEKVLKIPFLGTPVTLKSDSKFYTNYSEPCR